MPTLRCRVAECAKIFGPVVGPLSIVTVGQTTFALSDVLAIRCECGTLEGNEPQPIVCPSCQKKRGEMYRGYALLSSRGRSVWASRIVMAECRCGYAWEPVYRVALPLMRPRQPMGGKI